MKKMLLEERSDKMKTFVNEVTSALQVGGFPGESRRVRAFASETVFGMDKLMMPIKLP